MARPIKLVGIAILCVSLLTILIIMCTYYDKSHGHYNDRNRNIIDENKALIIAIAHAKELGYSPDDMEARSQRHNSTYVVTFLPTTDQLGGDLKIEIDARSGVVVNVMRGQ